MEKDTGRESASAFLAPQPRRRFSTPSASGGSQPAQGDEAQAAEPTLAVNYATEYGAERKTRTGPQQRLESESQSSHHIAPPQARPEFRSDEYQGQLHAFMPESRFQQYQQHQVLSYEEPRVIEDRALDIHRMEFRPPAQAWNVPSGERGYLQPLQPPPGPVTRHQQSREFTFSPSTEQVGDVAFALRTSVTRGTEEPLQVRLEGEAAQTSIPVRQRGKHLITEKKILSFGERLERNRELARVSHRKKREIYLKMEKEIETLRAEAASLSSENIVLESVNRHQQEMVKKVVQESEEVAENIALLTAYLDSKASE